MLKTSICRAVPRLIGLLLLIAPFNASAQDAPASCPTVRVSCPDMVNVGADLTFTADVSGGPSDVNQTYNWTVSAGSIKSGQGTSTIVVDTAGAGGQTITATVDVGGFARECATSSSCTASVEEKAAPAVKFGEYVTRDLSANKEKLDEFVLALLNDPEVQGYIIAYGGKTSRPEDAQKAADNATEHTMNTRKMDGARTLSGVGGYREEPTIELWIAPPGGAPPMATPTVAPEDVKPPSR
ncbi:MAG TPA: hypothetical protein VGQ36_27930 [Thermoanaerobaculia bacterium]|jgi:hypothetical protein|nr:hypothetical protein [Thermoanaerobaculia bacterium]